MFSFYNLLALDQITKAQKALLPTPYGEKTANLHGPKASLPHPFAWCRNLFGASAGSFLVPLKARFAFPLRSKLRVGDFQFSP